jgi:ribonuclease G
MIEPAAFWLYEDGIGETRAMKIIGGEAVALRIERAEGGPRAGAILPVKLARILGQGRGIGVAESASEILIDRLPKTISEGATLFVHIRRESINEKGRMKWPLARPAEEGAMATDGPDLLTRIAADALPIRQVTPASANGLDAYGWRDLIDHAMRGSWSFAGGELLIALTPAMTVIDIDGDLPPRALAFAAAPEVAKAINQFDLSGSVAIDFPTLEAKTDRTEILTRFDAAMMAPCERTAPNGFGLMQVVSRVERPSLLHTLTTDRRLSHALALLRQAERAGGRGAITITAHPSITGLLNQHPEWIEALHRRLGRTVNLTTDPKIPLDSASFASESEA